LAHDAPFWRDNMFWQVREMCDRVMLRENAKD
jgi:hypothetical protein